MSKVIDRAVQLVEESWTYSNAIAIASAEQLERIADALEKQSIGNQVDLEDSKFIPEDSNGPCSPGPSQICSP